MSKFLYQLISQLSSSEKGYFSKHRDTLHQLSEDVEPTPSRSPTKPPKGRPTGGESKTFALYQEICEVLKDAPAPLSEGNISDVEEFLTNWSKRKGWKMQALSDAKHNLYQSLLQALRQMQSTRSRESETRTLLQEAKILEGKGLLEAAHIKYADAQEIAEKHQLHHLTMEATKGLIRFTISQSKEENYFQVMETLFKTLENSAQLVLEESNWFTNRHRAYALRYERDEPRKTEKIKDLDAAIENGHTESFLALTHLNDTKALIAKLRKNEKDAAALYQTIADYWELPENQDLKNEYLHEYFTAINNALNACIEAREYSNFWVYITALKNIKLPKKEAHLQAERFQTLYFAQQLYFLNRAEFEECNAPALVEKIKNGLNEHSGRINRSKEAAFRYNMMLADFATRKYHAAYENSKSLLKVPAPQRPDLFTAGRLFQFIILFELNNSRSADAPIETPITYQNPNGLDKKPIVFDLEKEFKRKVAGLKEYKLHEKQPPFDFEIGALKYLLEIFNACETGNTEGEKKALTQFEIYLQSLEKPPTGSDAMSVWVGCRLGKGSGSFQRLMKEMIDKGK